MQVIRRVRLVSIALWLALASWAAVLAIGPAPQSPPVPEDFRPILNQYAAADEQSSDAAVSVQKGVDRLELVMGQSDLDQGG